MNIDSTLRIIDPVPSTAQLLWGGLRSLRKPKVEGVPRLPQERLVRPAVELRAADIERYARACGFRREHGVPMSFVHTLAFPLHLLLLTSPTFPWPASGMVHLANRIRQYRRLQPGQALRLQVHCERWVAHPKGQALLIVSQAHSDGSLVWESESLYLRRGVAAPVGDPWQADRALDEQALILTQRWSLAADLGRRFAKVSGDHNPIHTSWPGARLFGFKRPIAHGMWTLGRALAAQQPPRPLDAAGLDCEFKLPMFLPGSATLWKTPACGTHQIFEVRTAAGDKPHMRGVLTLT
ncbi:MaoC/PaaZ C-terminal domain-containing protein [Pseudomonas asplenii]|uniref:MaoC/PaaZ C-terminal domain-containing protein n=1 Tax=Pseudomonas asplenii TaxID=53407 RepID=UPI0022341218|nr:MaoC/PaaZ C-terminal domain-containing protein [Pseudomonas asplenii]UZE31771.1 acyl dehydratase [Pseudomonas asplenii]